MKQQIISEVVQQMLPHLDNAQMQQLQKVLENALFGCEITAQTEKSDTDNNPKLIDAFVAAKRIEGCSEKTLKYYRTTIKTMVASINKGIRHIQTEDLRSYLTDYQGKNQSSRVTIDNIRRILSSFFSWLEDEDYILKSPVRRIHKVKTATNIKETYTDEDLEKMRDNCAELRDLAMIDMLASTGMRIGEMVLLNKADINFNERECVVFGNYVLMGLEPSEQTYVYEHLWRPMEQLFIYETQGTVMDAFFRHYLTMKLSRIPKKERVYEEFKLYHLNCEFGTIRELCQDLLEYAKYYTNIVFKRNTDTDLKKLYEDIIDLRMEVSYPFLLKIHHDCVEGLITSDELKKILKLCISYVLRRAICEIPTNSMNKTFATLKNYIRPDDYLNSVKAFFVMQDTYKEFPDNDKFEGAFESRDIYNMRARNYILSRLENFENKAPIIIENYTIEHIMPQNKNLSSEWQADLGAEWQEVQKKYLHTIGNLTLTAYNSEMSDRPFLEKMDMSGGFKESALKLNKYVVLQNKWNEKHIQERANELAKKAESIWPYPILTAAELAPYQVEEKAVQKYSLETYDVNAFTRILFESLDKRIMNLSPAVKKEYKKLYVAYKLDTNFVDIVFQKQRLRISINMKFSEINDPNGICKDVTGLGRWGNGDVELFMEHQDELDQIMEIVKQSFDAQAE